MAEATPKADKSESMEEILQSIKRIMDDNGAAAEAKPAEPEVYELTNVIKEEPAAAAAPAPAAAQAPSVEEPAPPPVPLPPEPEPVPAPAPRDDADSLMSRQAKNAAANAFKKIESGKRDSSIPLIPSPHFRGGTSIEDLVLEVLRPMLKSWLDENLPIIAQKIVEKEVKRIVTFHYDQE